jgi:hypothetical protein
VARVSGLALRQYLRLVPEWDEMRKVCNQGHSARGFWGSAHRASGRSPVHVPPFLPLAERCALIEVESMDKVTPSLPQRASALKIACQCSRLAQRLKRL